MRSLRHSIRLSLGRLHGLLQKAVDHVSQVRGGREIHSQPGAGSNLLMAGIAVSQKTAEGYAGYSVEMAKLGNQVRVCGHDVERIGDLQNRIAEFYSARDFRHFNQPLQNSIAPSSFQQQLPPVGKGAA